MMTPYELEKLSIDDIELILRDQQDLYSLDELEEIKAYREHLLEQERKAQEAEKESRRLSVVTCPKCDGPNDPENTKCIYCEYQFREQDYYAPKNPVKHDADETENTDNTEDAENTAALNRFLGANMLFDLLFTLCGIVSIIYGNMLNNDFEAQWDSLWNHGQTDPGTPWIIFAAVAVVIGFIPLIYRLFRKK